MPLSLLAAFIAAFVFITSAFSAPPELRSNLPAKNLPIVTVTAEQIAAMQQDIGTPAASDFGITNDSFEGVRQVASTPIGALYLVPGTSGACLVLSGSSSCGDPGDNATPDPQGTADFLLLAFSQDGTHVYGGGIVTDAVKGITVSQGADSNVSVTMAGNGTFTLSGTGATDVTQAALTFAATYG